MSSIFPEIPVIGVISTTEQLDGELSPVTAKISGTLSSVSRYTGSLVSENSLIGILSGVEPLTGNLSQVDSPIEGTISDDLLTVKTFAGPYIVTPRKVEQILNTENKLMAHDVTVEEIHYSEVTNPQGGVTVNIGFE